jgi:hypothetical protein
MSAQSYTGSVTIEWDDSVVIVFSFPAGSTKYYGAFSHLGVALQNTAGSQTQVNAILQTLTQSSLQVSADPQTWVETIKIGGRGGTITIVYDDTINFPYTTTTAVPFQLQLLYSIHG